MMWQVATAYPTFPIWGILFDEVANPSGSDFPIGPMPNLGRLLPLEAASFQ